VVHGLQKRQHLCPLQSLRERFDLITVHTNNSARSDLVEAGPIDTKLAIIARNFLPDLDQPPSYGFQWKFSRVRIRAVV
jgi:hypothetical protein